MAILKLFHVLFVFVWVGSLLVLTRFLVYQAQETPEVQARLGKLLRRMYFGVDLPSMILAVSLGLVLLFLKDMNWKAPWLHMKLTFAFLLIVTDIITGFTVAKFSRVPIMGGSWKFRLLHSLAGLFLIGILIAIYILKIRY